jgi:hypothetical protein
MREESIAQLDRIGHVLADSMAQSVLVKPFLMVEDLAPAQGAWDNRSWDSCHRRSTGPSSRKHSCPTQSEGERCVRVG